MVMIFTDLGPIWPKIKSLLVYRRWTCGVQFCPTNVRWRWTFLANLANIELTTAIATMFKILAGAMPTLVICVSCHPTISMVIVIFDSHLPHWPNCWLVGRFIAVYANQNDNHFEMVASSVSEESWSNNRVTRANKAWLITKAALDVNKALNLLVDGPTMNSCYLIDVQCFK